jgi:Mg2+ and Co2+ transporter CorA
MGEAFRFLWRIVVHDMGDVIHVNAAGGDIGGDQDAVDTVFETLQRLVPLAPEWGNNLPAAGNLNLFVGRDFVITVHSEPVALLDRLRSPGEDMRADQVLYRVIHGVVESWLPSIERLEDSIERLQDQVIGNHCRRA